MKTQLGTSFALHFRPHEYGGRNRLRVWRGDWAGDMFEILSPDEFAALEVTCRRFAIPLIEAKD